ncbi:unnamed protein product, partial [Scytosiphon promiscuus]
VRQEKLQRVNHELRKSKPSSASAFCWKYFQCYVSARLKKYAICTLCMEQQELERSEIMYSQSPSNLLRHLNTDFPGHRDAYETCMNKKTGKKVAAAHGTAAGLGGQGSQGTAEITGYFGVDTSGWHQELVRWMVANAIPFSVR